MNTCISSILVVLAILSFADYSVADGDRHLNENLNQATVKKTKYGWQCAGVTCPIKFTASCKVTKILKPSDLQHTELLILCMDKNDKPMCGITRTRKGVIQEVLDVDENGNTIYDKKEVISENDGTKIPRCPRK
ncbi:uncharacterized protein LOC27208239 [Drosophila simulans]|uniref:Seminal fluid protein 78E n=2 Tax=melanogaster subgroup TaxID=32351 RepID=A0A0J9RZN7_DROSI|nr:uncharacterized protein LOC27208239 [Drosophila simulans]XP_033158484.1 uncharacterized protein LOC117139911 [Drosophila mauritiana]KMZ01074.1 uncharacterized protein Dsimw501_GD28391 [Drosophila simulans]